MSVIVVTNDAERAGDPARAATAVCGKLSCISAILPPPGDPNTASGRCCSRQCASVDGGGLATSFEGRLPMRLPRDYAVMAIVGVWFQGSDSVGSARPAANP